LARFTVHSPDDNPSVLAPLLKAARFEIPIGGTLKAPRIDTQALKQRLRSIGADLVDGAIAAGTQGLQRLLQQLPQRPLQCLIPWPRGRRSTPDADATPTPPSPASRPEASGSGSVKGPDHQSGPPAPSRREARKPPLHTVEKETPNHPGRLTPKERRA